MYDEEREVNQPQETDEFYESDPDAADPHDETAEAISAETPSELGELVAKIHSGASWFYWIAALSVVNSVLIASGADWNFFIGMGITQIVDGMAAGIAGELEGNAAMIVTAIALVVSISIAGMFAGMGFFSKRRHIWAFVLGMILYAGDGLLFLLLQDWMSFGFHIFALFCLFSGLKAALQLKQMDAGQRLELGPESA